MWLPPGSGADPTPYLNFIRDPFNPFYQNDATLYVSNYRSFINTGWYATWTPFDVPLTASFRPPGSNNEISGTGYQVLLTEVDPTTGLPRLMVGNLTGICSVLDNHGTYLTSVGSSTPTPSVDRNGNLQLSQYYYAAAQPSAAAAIKADAMFYAGAQNNGGQASAANPITSGNIDWRRTRPADCSSASGHRGPAGERTLYQYWSPVWGGGDTNFFHGQRHRPDLRLAPGQRRASPPPTRNGSRRASPTSPSIRSTAWTCCSARRPATSSPVPTKG